MRIKYFIFFPFLLLLLSASLYSQKIIKFSAGVLNQDPANKDLMSLNENVQLMHEGIILYSDSATLNSKDNTFCAFRNIRIIVNDTTTIYGDILVYNTQTKIASISNNVRLVDGTMVLKTEELYFDNNTKIAYYPNNGITTKEDKVLKSLKGYYHPNTKDFFFKTNVHLSDSSTRVETDSMKYNVNTQYAFFYGPTHIYNDSTYAYCESGWYNTGRKNMEISEKSFVRKQEQYLEAAIIAYDYLTELAVATSDVLIHDTVKKLIISGEYARMENALHTSFITGRAMAKLIDDKGDTLFLHADTLFAYTDTNNQFTSFKAYPNVRFFRQDLQGLCDSLYHSIVDSLTSLYYNPFLWLADRQFSADTIYISNDSEGLKSLKLVDFAFVVSRSDSAEYDQVKGDLLKAYFLKGKLDYAHVIGNSISLYYLREEEKDSVEALIGSNYGTSDEMKMFFEDNKIVRILSIKNSKMKVFPPNEVPKEILYLSGFNWLSSFRPKDKEDVFKRNPRFSSKLRNK